jgi:hypothetical protein
VKKKEKKMKKILLCLCFVFAVGLLFSACEDAKEALDKITDSIPANPEPVQEMPTQTVNGKQISLNMLFGYSKAGRVIQSNQTISVRRNVGFIMTDDIKIDGERYYFETDDSPVLKKGSDNSVTLPATGVFKYYVSEDGSGRGNEVSRQQLGTQYMRVVGDDLVAINGDVPIGTTITTEFSITSFNGSNTSPLPMSVYITLKVIE